MWDFLYRNATLATMSGDGYGLIENGAIAVMDGRIAWIGRDVDLVHSMLQTPSEDLGGQLVTPGLVDCHTHLVYAGSRVQEFEMRLNGATYEEIARAGGGIRSTVATTRAAHDLQLHVQSRARLERLLREGVTTVEIKSGYGLNLDSELKMLRVAAALSPFDDVGIQTTFLGAHALPPEYEGDKDGYIDLVCDTMIPAVAEAGLADAVDAFCEGIGFSPDQVRRVFDAAKAHDLPVKLHAEQLSDLSGAALAAEYGALSADHLEYVSESSIRAMAEAGTVGVLLPGAFYFLRETKKPPIDLFRKHGVPMALATDCNPGSSPATSLLLMLHMGCTLFQMTPQEAWAGVTCHAAKALGLEQEIGSLEVGKQADLAIWPFSNPAEVCYEFGFRAPRTVLRAGFKVV